MNFTKEQLDNIPIHFVLCTERTGSSLLSLMLNLNQEILSSSEEHFALYFWDRYKDKSRWTDDEILKYVEDFFQLAEKNTDLYFSKKSIFLQNLKHHKTILNYDCLIKLTYLHFIDTKDKSKITCIIDKQIKYFFHIPEIIKLFPNAKFIILTRDVRDNIVSKSNRKLNWNQHPLFLAYLWKQTYENIDFLKPKGYLLVRYEDFVFDSEKTLKEICSYLNVPFNYEMIETNGVYEQFLEQKTNDVDPQFLNHLKDFHSGLSAKPNIEKIGQYKSKLNASTLNDVEFICGKLLSQFGYELMQNNSKTIPVITRNYYCFLAKCYRAYLLKFYFKIPLTIKLLIKKIRGKKIDV